jgi:hypothetical protein
MKLNSNRSGDPAERRHFSTQHSAALCRDAATPKSQLTFAIICCAIALLVATAFVSGCETEVIDHGAYLPLNVPVNEKENYVAVVLLNRRAQNSVAVPGIQEKHLPDGRLQVAVQLRNRENRRIQVQANCEFKDAQGFALDSTPFQNVFLDENAQEQVNFVSMTDKAVKYTIRVREAR